MARGFETGSDNEKIDELQRQLDDIIDSQISSVGGNEDISIDSTRGSRNDASGDAGGVRSNEPIIHQITDVDSSGSSTGVFDKINLISSMIIVDYSTPTVDIELRFIQGTAKDGVKIKITPKVGRTLIIKSGGNILTSSDITVSDQEFYVLVKHSQAETGVTGGAYKILLSSGGGTDLLPLNNTWTGTNLFSGGATVRDGNFFIQNTTDITKQAKFDLSGAITGKVLTLKSSHTDNRTLTFPDTTTSLAGLGTLSQTWTGTNIFAGFVNVRDANYFIQNSADNTKQVKWDLASISTSTIRTLTLPNSTTTLAGLGVLSQSWTGTNNFVGITTMIDSNFGIKDFSDNTKVINFNASLISTGTTRIYSLPNSTTTLAGLGVVSQSWTGTNTFNGITNFNGNAIFNEDITLGSSTVDNITFVGETIGNIVPNTTSINDLGTPTKKFSSAWLNFSLNLFGSFTGGGTPGSSAGQAKLFTRFNGTKYELRVLFPSGISQLISTEP